MIHRYLDQESWNWYEAVVPEWNWLSSLMYEAPEINICSFEVFNNLFRSRNIP